MMLRNNLVVKGIPRQWVPNPALRRHLRKWGIELGDDMVLSLSASPGERKSRESNDFSTDAHGRRVPFAHHMPFTVSTVKMAASGGPFSVVRSLRTDAGAWRHEHAYEEDMNWPQTRDRGAFHGTLSEGRFRRTFSGRHPAVVLGDSDLSATTISRP